MAGGSPQAAQGRWNNQLALGWAYAVFAAGLILVLITGLPQEPWPLMIVAGALVVALDALAVRDQTRQPLSLAGVVLVAVAINGEAAATLLLALVSGLVIKTPRRPFTWAEAGARRALEGGARALGLAPALFLTPGVNPLGQMVVLGLSYIAVVQGARVSFSRLRHPELPWSAVLQRAWVPSLIIEILPLPLAALGAAIIANFDAPLIVLAIIGVLGAAVVVRRSIRSFGQQRRTVDELGQINAISRAIIRAELDVDALCNLIYAEASRVVDTSNFRLGLFNGHQFELKVRVLEGVREPALTVTLQEDEGLVGWMRRTGRSLLVHDFTTEMESLPARPTYQADDPPRSGVYIPLFTGDEVIGTISIQSRQPHAYDTEDLRILSLIADQAAIAISKARAFAAARRRAAQLATISEVSRQVTAILDLDRLLPSVVHRIRASFGYYQVHLFTVDPLTEDLVFRASTNPESPFWRKQGRRLAPGLGIIGKVATTGEPMLVNDVRDEPRFIPDQAHTAAELVVPLRVGTQMIGVLDVQSDQVNAFDENDFFVLQTLADQIAIAIDSANIFTAQQEEAWVLNALLQTAENIARASDIDELYRMAVLLPRVLLGCDHVLYILWSRDDQTWAPVAWAGFAPEAIVEIAGKRIREGDASFLAELRGSSEPQQLTAEQRAELCVAGILPAAEYDAVLALPLTTRANTLGLMLLDRVASEEGWVPRQITIANGIARQLAAAVEGALLAQAEAERQHLEQEINVARELQTSLLPARMPDIGGWGVAALWRSARQVGGDFYDLWQFTSGPASGQLGLVIADVSDKGVPAALFMALTRSLVRAAALDGTSPALAMEKANRWIMRDSQAYMFVTLFYAILDPVTGVMRYTCAGHNPPLLYRAGSGEVESLHTPGIALGVLEDVTLMEAETVLNHGDLLVCYTDGVTEAVNDAMDEWGLPRLIEMICALAHLSPAELLGRLSDGLAEHTGDRPPFDDVTLLAIKRQLAR